MSSWVVPELSTLPLSLVGDCAPHMSMLYANLCYNEVCYCMACQEMSIKNMWNKNIFTVMWIFESCTLLLTMPYGVNKCYDNSFKDHTYFYVNI